MIDSLDAFVRRSGRNGALGLFSRVCPQLYDLGAIAYWRISRPVAGAALLDGIAKVTQCVLELGGSHLRVVKAEGRPGVEGHLLHVRPGSDGTPRFEQEKALGRVGAGLRRVRQERRLSQADLARLAGVSPFPPPTLPATPWLQDISEYEHIHSHILEMSDALATGIITQFPVSRRRLALPRVEAR